MSKNHPNNPHQQHEVESDTTVIDRTRVDEPPMYKVILLNDDYTTMAFVVLVLQHVFHLSQEEAEKVMISVHSNGSGVAGIFTKEIAETKVAIVHQLARREEFPLKCRIEPT